MYIISPLNTAQLLSQEAITIGQNEDWDLTESRRKVSFRKNQTFNTIFYLYVAKMQQFDLINRSHHKRRFNLKR